jgi:dTDP-3-amino-3,4,6-trideoxy-alpha-D-glucopyranose N,N-dimethyltransferase
MAPTPGSARGQGQDGLTSPVRLLNMFDKSAHLYDLAYSFKDYAGESEWVHNAIHTRFPQARSLLDVACGTGKHLEHLRSEFDCQGLDLNPEFVELAQQRTDGVRVHGASMDSFDIDERFHAVVCLFSSIGYTSDLAGAIGPPPHFPGQKGCRLR